jgi:hypothetical protein
MIKQSRSSTWFFPFVGVLLSISFFLSPLFFGKTLFFGDNFSLFVPQRLFLMNSIKHGQVPLWNPYIMNGVPYFANISKSVLYPATYLFAFFHPGVAVNVLVLSHLLISGLGMYWLMHQIGPYRKWQALLASVLWMFSLPFMSAVNNLVILQTITWIPWVFGLCYNVCIKKRVRDLPWLIIVTVLHLLGGHTQPVIYTALLCSGVALYALGTHQKRAQTFLHVLLWGGVTLLLSSAILLPVLDYSRQTTRLHTTITEALAGSFHPLSLIQFVLPFFWSYPPKGIAWGPAWGVVNQSGGYITIIGLTSLFLFGKTLWQRRKLNQYLLIIAIFSFVSALGKFFPPFSLAYRVLPFIRFVRSPSSILLLWSFSTAILVPQALSLWKFKPQHWFKIAGSYLALIIVLLISLHFFPSLWGLADQVLHHKLSASPFHTLVKDRAIAQVIVHNIAIAGGLTVLILFCLATFYFSRTKAFLGILIFLIILEMRYVDQSVLFFAPSRVYQPNSQAAEAIQKIYDPQYRFVTSVGLYPWTGFASYWENIFLRPPFQESRFNSYEQRDFSQLQLKRDLLATDWGMPYNLPTSYGYSTFVMQSTANAFKLNQAGSNLNELDMKDFHVPQINEFGGKYILIDKTVFNPQFWQTETVGFQLVEDHPTWALYLNPQAQPIIQGNNIQVSQVQRQPNSLSFEVIATQSTQVVMKETYEKGWKAWVNSTPTSITAAGQSRAIQVPSGKSTVILKYQPQSITRGFLLSLLGFFGLIGVFWWSKR